MSFDSKLMLALALAVLGGFGLVACGGDDSVDASDPLVQAIADELMADSDEQEGQGLFGGDRANAECFGVEVVGSVGKDRLNELGFTVDTIPADFQVGWSASEIDNVIDGLDKCGDVVGYTKNLVLEGASDEDADCILNEIGDTWFLDFVRATFAAGTDEAAAEAAGSGEFEKVETAYETCGVPLD